MFSNYFVPLGAVLVPIWGVLLDRRGVVPTMLLCVRVRVWCELHRRAMLSDCLSAARASWGCGSCRFEVMTLGFLAPQLIYVLGLQIVTFTFLAAMRPFSFAVGFSFVRTM
jgi:hypothetical protein